MTAPVALVTGGAQGIGAAICRRLAAGGHRVAVFDIDGDGARQIAAGLDGAIGVEGDAADEPGVEAVLDGLAGVPKVVVNNAGIVSFGPLLAQELDDWRRVVEVNLTGVFVMARAAARRMVDAGGGAIINVTSMNGVAPGPNSGAYGATKAGVILLTQQMAIEWGPLGIRVNAVAPGLIDAGMSTPIYADAGVRAERETRVPLGRLGLADDVAAAVAWLASDEAAYITGQNLLVDGGVTMNMIGQLPRPKSVDKVGPDGSAT